MMRCESPRMHRAVIPAARARCSPSIRPHISASLLVFFPRNSGSCTKVSMPLDAFKTQPPAAGPGLFLDAPSNRGDLVIVDATPGVLALCVQYHEDGGPDERPPSMEVFVQFLALLRLEVVRSHRKGSQPLQGGLDAAPSGPGIRISNRSDSLPEEATLLGGEQTRADG